MHPFVQALMETFVTTMNRLLRHLRTHPPSIADHVAALFGAACAARLHARALDGRADWRRSDGRPTAMHALATIDGTLDSARGLVSELRDVYLVNKTLRCLDPALTARLAHIIADDGALPLITSLIRGNRVAGKKPVVFADFKLLFVYHALLERHAYIADLYYDVLGSADDTPMPVSTFQARC